MHGVSPHPELLVTFLGSAALHALEGLLYPRSLALYMYLHARYLLCDFGPLRPARQLWIRTVFRLTTGVPSGVRGDIGSIPPDRWPFSSAMTEKWYAT
jgi:hypothetical protein